MQLFQQTIEFLGVIIGNSKILLQPHISKKILTFPDKIEKTKELQKFLGLLNYARPFIKNLPLINDYLIIETDRCSLGYGAVLLAKPHKYSAKNTEKFCRYSSEKYKENGHISSIDVEVLVITYAIDSFRILIISKKRNFDQNRL